MKRAALWLPLVLLLAMVIPTGLIAQSAATAAVRSMSDRCSLVIRADLDSALVFVDARLIGRTPLTFDSLAAGMHRVTIVHPDVSNWLTASVTDSLNFVPGERKTRSYALGRLVSINTIPSGASLFIKDSLAGTTPIILQLDTTQRTSLFTLRKDGYHDASVDPWQGPRGFFTIGLTQEWQANSPGMSAQESASRVERSPAGLYLSGAATVVSGITAAYLKTRANDRQALYSSTNDPGLLAERNRLDNWSAVALVVTEISFGLFAYFLLSE